MCLPLCGSLTSCKKGGVGAQWEHKPNEAAKRSTIAMDGHSVGCNYP